MRQFFIVLMMVVLVGCNTTQSPEVSEEEPITYSFGHSDLKCLSDNVYHEARGESIDGQIAVARVTLNRLISQIRPFDKYETVCDVVYDGGYGKEGNTTCQFAWTCDTIADEVPDEDYINYIREFILLNAIVLENFDCVLYYHADDGRERGWIKRGKLKNPTKVDNHLFYKDTSCT